jgi:glycine/D-amino acid oxidase-like deaminating enzyme/nitrite reductase/ring-hydroxylating ferredoxin subunit
MEESSLWKKISHRPTNYPPLKENIDVDVLIIGGGITGITAAHELLEAGQNVALVEAKQIGGVTTSMSTGNLYVPIQPFYQTIVSKFGIQRAAEVAQSRSFAINYIEKKVIQYNISCHFTKRPWFAFTNGQRLNVLEDELNVFEQIKVKAEYTHQLPMDLNFKKAIVIEDQARFNPLQYVISMAEELKKNKCLIYEETQVLEIKEKRNSCTVTTSDSTITAKKVIMATHTPIGVNITQGFTAPYRSYVVSVELQYEDHFDGHLWSLDEPSFSLSTHAYKNNKPDLLMVAGNHHKTGQTKNMKHNFKSIEQFIRKKYAETPVAFQWSAQHYHSADGLPYIGLAHRKSKHVYMATGYFADGLVYGTIAGMVIADLILKKDTDQKELYEANRFTPLASMKFLMKENTNVMAQYVKDMPMREERKFTDIKVGEGRVVEINRQKCAVSRDVDDKLHIVSAVCPHMKCIVDWNNAERTWDCPCHGSRFTSHGQLIEGPATSNLADYKGD